MKDNFSNQADKYSKFRPTYPQEMIDFILQHVSEKHAALDIATGNGQVAMLLSSYFDEVYATDISKSQLENAAKLPNIIYSLQPAESTSFTNNKFDLITVAQAVHWFDFDKFYTEVKRILKPEGIFAILGYGLLQTNPEADRVLSHFYSDIIGPYWDPERKYLDENYTTIPFPFTEFKAPKLSNNLVWSYRQLEGYLETWSAVEHYKNANGKNPLDIIRQDLKQSWEKGDGQVTFPLLLRIGKQSK
jgi:ubiquinone/menaquinone biosynthesis C-methylase UbiE